jgi:hypothetical protein
MATKRIKCVYCGKRLKPLPGHGYLNPFALNLELTKSRHEVCRACGREQPPGTEWTDFKEQIRGMRSEGAAPSLPPAPSAVGLPPPPPSRSGGDLVGVLVFLLMLFGLASVLIAVFAY